MIRSVFLSISMILAGVPASLQAQDFDQFFEEGVMRLDLVFSGTATESDYALEKVRRETYYSGPRTLQTEPFDYGDQKFELRDAATGLLIFSQCYSTLFWEWLTTTEARELRRAFSHVLRFPWPRQAVKVEVFDRNREGDFISSWSATLDPATVYADPTRVEACETRDLEIHGPAESKVDLLFLAEGYRPEEMEKFLEDARRSMEYIFSEEPFLSHRHDFNVRAVLSASEESGPDLPGEDIWKRTVLNANFYTFGIERYMTTSDYWSVCNVAANAHYDQVYILVNTDKYGGGGIFNYYSISAADNEESRAVVIHEFGHAFAGLADEYYNSKVAYNEYFPLEVEPWQPNLTTLVDFGSKWKDLVGEEVPVPTPAEEGYSQTVGVYEGGGYVSKDVYRPMISCRMHSNEAPFCPVCSRAIEAMIKRHCKY